MHVDRENIKQNRSYFNTQRCQNRDDFWGSKYFDPTEQVHIIIQ